MAPPYPSHAPNAPATIVATEEREQKADAPRERDEASTRSRTGVRHNTTRTANDVNPAGWDLTWGAASQKHYFATFSLGERDKRRSSSARVRWPPPLPDSELTRRLDSADK